MKLAAYLAVSTGLAAAVVLRAFHERPNFYSACVYLAQSNACLMILTNILLIATFGLFYSLELALFGRLRPIEYEQLAERGWYAMTELALAMTIFREDLGGWFLVMFVSLLLGKVWQWIGEGRIAFLEQQPPSNPRLFHARLATSLTISCAFDYFMVVHCFETVLEDARPGMMLMFGFEFAVLAIASTSNLLRYFISLYETLIVHQQTQARLEERRAERRAAQEQAEESGADGTAGDDADLAEDEEIEEGEIEGWEDKGRWVFYLDLATDFLKLAIYLIFFVILMAFHGIPIHIVRDVYVTARSFFTRINDFLRYRSATKDMSRYPDAMPEELQRENTCIICREEMTPWTDDEQAQQGQQQNQNADARAAARSAGRRSQRLRPKKLPCGHILHLHCLRSWLERQQACPTCRRPVLPGQDQSAGNRQNADGAGAHAQEPDQPQGGRNPPPPQGPRLRVFNFGPLRVAFGAGPVNAAPNLIERLQQLPPQGPTPTQNPPSAPASMEREQTNIANHGSVVRHAAVQQTTLQLRNIEMELMRQIRELNVASDQLAIVDALHREYIRLSGAAPTLPPIDLTSVLRNLRSSRPSGARVALPGPTQALAASNQHPALGPGHPELPPGLTVPPGWTVLPLYPSQQALYPAPSSGLTVQLPGGQVSAMRMPNFFPTPTAQPRSSPSLHLAPQDAPDHRPPEAPEPSGSGQALQGEKRDESPRAPLSPSEANAGEASGSTSKGKGRAAYVEDAEDSDE